MGFENFEVLDSQLTAQSHPIHIILEDGKEMDTHARCGRLNMPYCAFCGSSENGQYLQVDLRQDYIITGVATQGFEALDNNYFVGSYNLSHSRDGQNWSIFPDVMKGNDDGISVVNHTFSSPMYARYIQLYPTTYSQDGFCLRMELYGCLNSSSTWNTIHSPTTQRGASNATSENLPPTTRTTAASSTEQFIEQPAGSSKVMITTQGGKNTLPSESETVNGTTQVPRDDPKKHSSKTLIISIVAVLAVVIIIVIIYLLVRYFNYL